MRITFGPHYVVLQKWESTNGMKDFVKSCEAGGKLLGEDWEDEGVLYSVTVYLRGSPKHRYGIGIRSGRHGLPPSLLLKPEVERVVLAFNASVISIDPLTGYTDFFMELDSLFYAFLPIYSTDTLIVVQEVGVLAMTMSGQILWRYINDVVSSFEVDKQFLHLEFMDAAPVRLRLSDGIPL